MRLLQTLLVTLAFCLGIIAQDSELNSRAVSLPPPHYPATAMAVNAGGPVRVEVLVSESGRVITATAVSGHPLLRGPAAEAARKAIFKPATVNNVPVQFSGFLIYQFPPKYVKADVDFTWLSFSLNLGALRAVGTDSDLKLITAQSSKMLPEEFAEEKKLLANLANVSGAGQHEIINQVIDSFQTNFTMRKLGSFLWGWSSAKQWVLRSVS